MENQNGQAHGAPQPIMGQDSPPPPGIMAGAQNMLNAVKGPVFWVAVGYFACKFLDRKNAKT